MRLNNDYLIETPYGWCDFSGVRKITNRKVLKINADDILIATPDHRLFKNKKEVFVKDLVVGDYIDIYNGESKIKSIEEVSERDVYDIVGVINESSSFYSNNIISHNCSFTGSSYTLIDGDKLASYKPMDPNFYTEEGYYMWQKPVPHKIYMVTCDVAKGSNNDYHVANVWDVSSWHINGRIEQVAMYRRNDVSIFDFKDKIRQIASQYNKAMAVIENNNLGAVVVQNLYFEDGYENVWFDVDKGDYGINANAKTKPLALSYFKEDVESGKMLIRSVDMLTELSYFEEVRTGIFQARPGRGFFDDTVVSGYWTSYALRSRFWEDHLHFILQNKDLAVIQNSDNEANDEEAMKTFIKAFGSGSSNPNDDIDRFRNELSHG